MPARSFPGGARRGFTLVELMIVVAIIGVLAAIAVYGVRRYLAASKTAEAKQSIGQISSDATAAYEREGVASEAAGEGSLSAQYVHQLCGTATPVPAAVPQGTKYQPNTATGADFETGDKFNGWNCLGFDISQPIYYQYHYTKNGSTVGPGSTAACTADCYEAGAIGDLDGDTAVSRFARTGQINMTTRQLKASSQVYIEDEHE